MSSQAAMELAEEVQSIINQYIKIYLSGDIADYKYTKAIDESCNKAVSHLIDEKVAGLAETLNARKYKYIPGIKEWRCSYCDAQMGTPCESTCDLTKLLAEWSVGK